MEYGFYLISLKYMAVSYDSAVNQQGWKKAKQNVQNKKYISREKHKVLFHN